MMSLRCQYTNTTTRVLGRKWQEQGKDAQGELPSTGDTPEYRLAYPRPDLPPWQRCVIQIECRKMPVWTKESPRMGRRKKVTRGFFGRGGWAWGYSECARSASDGPRKETGRFPVPVAARQRRPGTQRPAIGQGWQNPPDRTTIPSPGHNLAVLSCQ